MQKLTNRNAEIRVVDLVLGLDLEMTVVLVPEVANMCVHLCVCLYVCVRVCVHPASLHSKKSYAMKLSFTFRLGKTALLPKNHDIQVYQLFGLEPFPQSIYIWHPFDKTEPPCEETDIKQNNAYNVATRMCGARVDAIDQPPYDVLQPGNFISSFGLLWIKIFIQTNMNYLLC